MVPSSSVSESSSPSFSSSSDSVSVHPSDDSDSTDSRPPGKQVPVESDSYPSGSSRLKAPKFAFVNAAGFKRSIGDEDVFILRYRKPKEVVAATGSISAELAAQQSRMEKALHEDPVLHPDYPRNLLPKEYQEYEDVFSKVKSNRLPAFRGPGLDHEINLIPGSTPPIKRMIPLSQIELEATEKYISENLPIGHIKHSQSPAGAPILFVKKKDGSLRFCVDYRGLNKITVKNKYPLPLISESLDRLQGAKIFTKLDLRNGYHNVRIKKGDEWKTAFRTRNGLFEYTTMPFGLTNAPATFQHLVNHIFRDFLDIFVVVYIDDILIFSKNKEDHQEHVRKVLQRLRENDLFAKPEKCSFHTDTVEYLGFIVSPKGVTMDPIKVKAISEWILPRSVHDVQVFLGFANYYRRFIRDYSKVALPLTSLLRKEYKLKKFHLSEDQIKAFEFLKSSFTSAPVLAHYDPSRPCILEADSSDFAIAGVLSQFDEKQILHPIAFYSRKLTPPETNYDIGDKELLAIVDSIKHWRRYFESDIHSFTVFSDHKNLQSFMEEKVLTRRQVRWMIFLSEFDFVIKYRTGKLMGKPDAMTRRHDLKEGSTAKEQKPQILLPPSRFGISSTSEIKTSLNSIPSQIFSLRLAANGNNKVPMQDRIRSSLSSDTFASKILPYLNDIDLPRNEETLKSLEGWHMDEEGLIYFNQLLYVPDTGSLRLDILRSVHDSPSAGHFGIWKTYELLTRNYWWKSCRSFVKDYVGSCDVCQRNKVLRRKPAGLLQPLPIPEKPWQSISWDFIVELPKTTNGNSCILVVVDRLTKESHFIPCDAEITAPHLASLFLQNIYRLHGLPKDIVSDRGTLFTSKFWKSFLKLLSIQPNYSTAFHPQSDGQTEIVNAVLEQYLRMYCNYQQTDWEFHLPLAEVAYNNSIHSSTKSSPWFANKGFHPIVPSSMESTDQQESSTAIAAQELVNRIDNIHSQLKENLEEAQEHQKQYYDEHHRVPPEYQVGDLVFLSSKNIAVTRPSRKLSAKRLGPYPIEKIIGPNAVKLSLPPSMKIHPVFHVSLLEPKKKSQIYSRTNPPPPPVEIEGQEELEYEVEEILDSRIYYGSLQYLVSWKGYSPSENSWEPPEHLENSPELINQFHHQYPDRPGPHSLPKNKKSRPRRARS